MGHILMGPAPPVAHVAFAPGHAHVGPGGDSGNSVRGPRKAARDCASTRSRSCQGPASLVMGLMLGDEDHGHGSCQGPAALPYL